MHQPGRWDRCISQYNEEAKEFIGAYFGDSSRQVLLVAAAGFDPRSDRISQLLSSAAGARLRAVFILEQRPNPNPELVSRAAANLVSLVSSIGNHCTETIEIFANDGAVVGGRRAASLGNSIDLNGITDVVVDMSALSKGVSFPLVRQLHSRIIAMQPILNLHLMVSDDAVTDSSIVAVGSDKVSTIHGFSGDWNLAANRQAAKLWLPQLSIDKKGILDRIFNTISPHDVCPILPFPATQPRRGDELVEHYADEFESVWSVDARNIVYAMENRPLDLYRTLRRIASARSPVFAAVHGSLTMLSPIGSKVLSIGALMAAIEENYPVVYVEALSYDVDYDLLDRPVEEEAALAHVWLHGDVYYQVT